MTVPDNMDVLPPKTTHPSPPFTLAIDIGGTGLKASILDSAGAMVADRVKIPTTYPLPPDKLVEDLAPADQAPAGLRKGLGRVPGDGPRGPRSTAPHFILKSGPGSDIDPALKYKWSDFPLANAPTKSSGRSHQGGERRRPSGRGCDRRPRLRDGVDAWDRVRGRAASTTGTCFRTGVRPHAFPQRRDLQRAAGKGPKEIGDERWKSGP